MDESAAASGWVPEPITTDPATYAQAALAAASTFDTTLGSRDAWLAHLDSWFTPDIRYATVVDREAELAAAKLELRQGVVLPEATWESMAAEEGRVTAQVSSEVALTPVAEDPSGDMQIATADVELTFTQSDGGDGETSYIEEVRVSVQVLCGPESVPTPETEQAPGDCKVVRYFTEPVEP